MDASASPKTDLLAQPLEVLDQVVASDALAVHQQECGDEMSRQALRVHRQLVHHLREETTTGNVGRTAVRRVFEDIVTLNTCNKTSFRTQQIS